AAAFAPLFSAERLPSLRRLILPADLATDLIDVLAGSTLLPGLEEIDLSNGGLTDEGAHRIRAAWPRFSHLSRLDVRNNWLPPGEARALEALSPRTVLADVQRGSVHEDRSPLCDLPASSLFSIE